MLSTVSEANIMDVCFAAAREFRCRDIAREMLTLFALMVCSCSLVTTAGGDLGARYARGLGGSSDADASSCCGAGGGGGL